MRVGTIAGIEQLVSAGKGVAVLPRYLVAGALGRGRLRQVLPGVKLASDYFRLVFRRDDPQRVLYESIAESMLRKPLR